MSDTISRAMIRALQPPGSLWITEDDEGLDKLYDGLATNLEEVKEFLSDLAYIRSPELTALISDLEKEHGLLPDSTLTDTERRARLVAAKTANKGDGTSTFLQKKIRESGFDLYVHENDPPVDPALFQDATAEMFGRTASMFGRTTTQFGSERGFLIINGRTDDQQTPLPTTNYWGMMFFVGGAATRDPITNELLTIASGPVQASRREEIVQLIVKYKPLHSWCGLLVYYT